MTRPHDDLYDLAPMKAPRLAGASLRMLATTLEGPLGRVVADKLLADAGVLALRGAVADDPLPLNHPLLDRPLPDHTASTLPERTGPSRVPARTVEDFAAAYREQRSTPEQVARRFLAAHRETESVEPKLRAFIAQREDDLLEQARASVERHRRGQPLSVLDGVPVAVKDELDQRGYPTTVGTRFLGNGPVPADAEVVARLRAMGALLVGKTNMHEVGLGVTGVNPNHGPARNPYDPSRITGGSSSGSAAAVAAGLAPLAVGADGGGSIRIPAALCGQVGLKPTFGRLSGVGSAGVCWTVGHLGPIGATVRDVAHGYLAMAGPDPRDPVTRHQPAPLHGRVFTENLDGVRLAVFRPWFEDADPEVVHACETMLAHLEAAGARVVEVKIPELAALRAAHQVTILSEMATSQRQALQEDSSRYGADVRGQLAIARLLEPQDYVHAQRLRPRILRHFLAALEHADAIVTPATACTATAIPPDALETGESNLPLLDRLTRFVPAGNFTGLPAISFPAGYDHAGLPIGFQAMGRPWDEAALLRIAWAAEQRMERRRPAVHHDLLG